MKARSEPGGLLARRPAQKRSQLRVGALLDAADALLEARALHEISLHDIAHGAGVPPSSAYHFFPTREAAFLSLARRHLDKLHQDLLAADLETVDRWQDYICLRNQVAVAFFNASAPARKLMLGSAVGSEIRTLDYDDIEGRAQTHYAHMDQFFVMPFMRQPELKFRVLIGIYDGIWASAYAKYGHITEVYAQESRTAGVAYLSTILPPVIPLRHPGERPAQPVAP